MELGKRRIGPLSLLLLFLNSVLVILLLISYLSFHINPNDIPYLAFAGIAYPYTLLANIMFVLFWIFYRFKFAILPLIVILAGWNHVARLYQFGGTTVPASFEDSFNVVSYNLQNFLKLNTTTTKYITDFENQDKIIGFLKDQQADIYCLQEMFNDRSEAAEFCNSLANGLNCKNYYYENYYHRKDEIIDAIVIFTKYRIINKGHLEYDDKTTAIFVDVIKREDTIRIYNLHLASINFKQEDIDFWKDIQNNNESYDQELIKTGTRNLVAKMNIAYIKRSFQVDINSGHIKGSLYPVIVCGDCNDTPLSYTYHKISSGLQDAFVISGKGLGITYAGEHLPAYRIDYIFCDPVFKVSGFIRHKETHSDHYPISCFLN
ncbi:MAG: endonuclease/exonuclease/phosphatase family protein [Bacteroidales bacterium]|nr:endonuclease/exonuclease/phosphatase family protein [Bacteroidales bacterium]